MKIDLVSDVVCPWCAIGLASLQEALRRLGDGVPVALHVQPFELNPQMGPEGEDLVEHLSRKYGISPAQIEQGRQDIAARGAALGFTFGPRSRIWNTFDAHRLLHWAGLEGRQPALKTALLQSYHGRGENVSDPDVLVRVAGSVGLDEARARALLASDEFADAVRANERRWQQAGISSVPAVIVDGRYLISGGQPPEVFEQVLRQVLAEA
ncbi:putative DsbA family dithiol-disulfide isomerase [Sphaerotilus hippei]|uniref:Putative DsbA family dithiol-disulfide isomerase n=1 Tax=Sphaerotilus hippei TaxID=744406 RepID=A0A318HDV9_9BURK|nr:DsbA family oxidoreductase [Sphaerotilus hippei]PXW99449.1 putative DsbA family dithiol-disulfide isomerase [Sphaerotilus hippei]